MKNNQILPVTTIFTACLFITIGFAKTTGPLPADDAILLEEVIYIGPDWIDNSASEKTLEQDNIDLQMEDSDIYFTIDNENGVQEPECKISRKKYQGLKLSKIAIELD